MWLKVVVSLKKYLFVLISRKILKYIRTNVKEAIIVGPVYNYTESGVQLIIKHPHLDLNDLYKKLSDKYQDNNLFVIIDCFPRSIL